jgi:parvulin-like peptidyl-prolyl isomerase
MQRWTTVAVGLVFAGIVGTILFKGRAPAEKPPSGHSSASSPVKSAAPPASASSAALAAADAGGSGERGFDTLPDGKPVPELPASAPKAVSFGVILFMYQGSQAAPKDAPTKEQALERARAVIAEAKKDFGEAVKKGDRGSTSDAGRIPRGVLEPALEFALFSLEKNGISDEPIDTPRGFWVLKRTE